MVAFATIMHSPRSFTGFPFKKEGFPPVRIACPYCLMVKRNPTCTGWDGSKHRSGRSYQLVKTPFVIKQLGSHQTWSNYSDLTRPHPKWWFSKENPLISRKPRLVKYINLARIKLDSRRLSSGNYARIGQWWFVWLCFKLTFLGILSLGLRCMVPWIVCKVN